MFVLVCCIAAFGGVGASDRDRQTSRNGFSVDLQSGTGNSIYSSRSSDLDNLSDVRNNLFSNVKNDKFAGDRDYTVVRFNNKDGSPSRTVILPKLNSSWESAEARLPPKDIRASGGHGALRGRPYHLSKIFNPNKLLSAGSETTAVHIGSDSREPFFDRTDGDFVLISDSSRPVTTPVYTSDSIGAYPSTIMESTVSSLADRPQHRRYKIKRRKVKKNSTVSPPRTDIDPYAAHRATPLERPFANHKDAKFLNLFTIIQFPNDACSEEGGTCYHELECTGLGGVPTTRCAHGYGVCCNIEATCGARTNINNTVFVGSETNLGSCSISIDKVPCTKQIRLDFVQLELEPPMDGECVKDRLFITGANRNVNVPVLCGSLTGQHIYLDVDDVMGPVVLNLISTRPIFRIKISQVCDGNPMLAPKSCLQFYRGLQGVIRSFNYVPASTTSSYLNNLNYAVCINKEPSSCSITYTNESPDGMEFELDIVNVDEDGSLSVPPRQAGAEVFNCPDDYISISNVRLCGQKLNDGSVQVDFTKNYPVTDSTGGPFIISVRSNEANVGKGFYLNYQQKAC